MSLRQNMTTFPSAKLTFSYQSECHCAKTAYFNVNHNLSLVTSQNVTAPKQSAYFLLFKSSLVTSQNVTAPKLDAVEPLDHEV